jgi:transposase
VNYLGQEGSSHGLKISASYQQGTSTYDLAKRYNVSRTAIKLLLRRQGVQIKRPTRKLSQEPPEVVEAQVVQLRLEGVRHSAIATRVGVSGDRVREILVRKGLHTRLSRGQDAAARRKVKPEQVPELLALYAAGATIEALAERYGCSFKPVKTLLVRAEIPLRPRGQVSPYRTDPEFKRRVLELWGQGVSIRKVCLALGVGPNPVSKVLQDHGITNTHAKGERHGMWKGGRVVNGYGYVMVRLPLEHPLAVMRTVNGYVLEHRLVVAESLGRPLESHESVHHINGDHADNRLENLQLRTGQHGAHVRYKCSDCGSHNVQTTEL